jgi:hypothetical protein
LAREGPPDTYCFLTAADEDQPIDPTWLGIRVVKSLHYRLAAALDHRPHNPLEVRPRQLKGRGESVLRALPR